MSSKKIIICIVFSLLILAILGLTACESLGLDLGLSGKDGEEDGEKVSISGGTNSVNNTIEQAKSTNGILISYTINSTEEGNERTTTVTFGANGEKYYYLIEGEETIYDLSGSTGMDMYTKAVSDTLWTKSTTPYSQFSKQQATALINETYTTFVTYMTSYSIYSAEGSVFVKAGTEKIAGHNCTKYKYTASILGASMSTIYWVEESTGICFKVGYEGNFDGEEAAGSIVLTKYQETYTINIPTENQIVKDSDCSHSDLDNDGICDLCGEPYDPKEEACNHIDSDNDGICDICDEPYDPNEEACNHIDSDNDGYCDKCDEYYDPKEEPCKHIDFDKDGICDICDESCESQTQDPTALDTPSVDVDPNSGLASWDAIPNATGYICKVNGVDKAKQTGTTIQLNDNDTLQVKAVGDGDKKRDSGWSKQVLYKTNPQYDFSNLGLSTMMETLLKRYEGAEAGYYEDFDSDTYKCTNGDVIIDDGNNFIDIFSRINGYTKLTVVYHYTSNDTTDYRLVDYKDNKKAYYEDLYYALYLVKYTDRAPTVYADYQEFIDASSYDILDYNEYNTDDQNSYELVSYTEYSGDFDRDYLNTKYMHPSRSFSYLDDYSSKISSWTINRVNMEGKNYSDNKITIQFSEDFTEKDYLALLTYLRDEYALAADEGYDFALSSYGANDFEGEINVYDFPYEGEGDSLADRYKLLGGTSVNMPYLLTVQYTYLTWYDGGTFATYVTTPNGLFRIVDGSIQLMIAPDGTVQEHILPPYKTLNNFEFSYTLDAEGDAENEAEGYFVNTYTVKKVGDYILLTTTSEYSKEYTVYRIDDKMLYYREGTYYNDSTVEWNDFDCYEDRYYNQLDVYGDLINEYFVNQFKCTKTGSTSYVGEPCTTYAYADEEEDKTYTYYANIEGITLRYIEETSDGYVYTKELTSYDDSVSSFTTQEQSIIDDSGISGYNGEE